MVKPMIWRTFKIELALAIIRIKVGCRSTINPDAFALTGVRIPVPVRFTYLFWEASTNAFFSVPVATHWAHLRVAVAITRAIIKHKPISAVAVINVLANADPGIQVLSIQACTVGELISTRAGIDIPILISSAGRFSYVAVARVDANAFFCDIIQEEIVGRLCLFTFIRNRNAFV